MCVISCEHCISASPSQPNLSHLLFPAPSVLSSRDIKQRLSLASIPRHCVLLHDHCWFVFMPCTSKVTTYHPWFFLGFLPWIRVHALTSHALPALGIFSLKFCIFKGNIVIPIHISIQSYILKITTEVIDTSRCWIYINGTTTHGSIIVVVLFIYKLLIFSN